MKTITSLFAFSIAVTLLVGRLTSAQAPSTPSPLPVYFADGNTVANAHIVIGQISVPEGGGPVDQEGELRSFQ